MPTIDVFQLLPEYIICALPVLIGAIAPISSRSPIAFASLILSAEELPDPLREPDVLDEPDNTTNKLLPMESIDLLIACCAPSPMAIIRTTAPTPITMPSIVKNVRRRLALIACQASLNIEKNI